MAHLRIQLTIKVEVSLSNLEYIILGAEGRLEGSRRTWCGPGWEVKGEKEAGSCRTEILESLAHRGKASATFFSPQSQGDEGGPQRRK